MYSSHERRKAERRPGLFDAICKLGPNLRAQVSITDITCEGCQIAIKDKVALEQGAHVILKFAELEGLAAQVKWTIGNKLGLEFERPLHEAVLDHLLDRSNPAEVRRAGAFTDKFGRRLKRRMP
jgi:hypothetical protein